MREVELDLNVAPAKPTEDFIDLAGSFGIEFEPGDTERLGHYLSMLMKANEAFNLTAVKDVGEAWMRHIFDSLTLLPVLAELPEGGRVIDVGSGGGLPGLPLAICSPQLRFTLLEATGKKAEFLRRAVEKLGLANVRIAQERAERAGHDRGDKVSAGGITTREGGLREAYDLAVARAVGPMATIAELTVPFVKIGGRVALIKGQKAEEELAQAGPALHLLKVVHAATVETPTGRIVILEKSSATPKMYPRPDGEPKRKPLGV
ncbi:MAG: 16S rRNA (guanine(527)-N(7))-methyltransferase RsmG [Phycisphaerales bacterium]|nr:16S rRNA (guanine(527)-N(7))-methyltransferase RsmG [Phycisphaerales bacterium]